MKTVKILMALFVIGLLTLPTSCNNNEPTDELKNQISEDGTKTNLTTAAYYTADLMTEFSFKFGTDKQGMLAVTNNLITGNKIDVTTIGSSTVDKFLNFHYMSYSFGNYNLQNWTGWVKIVKTDNPLKYNVSFEFKQGTAHTITANFDVTQKGS